MIKGILECNTFTVFYTPLCLFHAETQAQSQVKTARSTRFYCFGLVSCDLVFSYTLSKAATRKLTTILNLHERIGFNIVNLIYQFSCKALKLRIHVNYDVLILF